MVRKENELKVSTLLTRGIAAAKAGKREEARSLLAGALQRDANNEQALLWLGGVVGNPRETLICLRRVLALNPDNRQAQEGIKWAKAKLAQSRGLSPPISPGDGDAPTSSLVTSASSAAKEVSFTQRSSETAVLPSGPASVPKRPNLRVAVVSPPVVEHTIKSLAQEQRNGITARGLARIGLIPLLMILLLSLTLVIGLALLQWLLSP
jgi:tetratricopeptide (TPR) repeat protein